MLLRGAGRCAAMIMVGTLAGCAAGQGAGGAAVTPRADAGDAHTVARIEAAVPRLLAEGEVPGVAVALIEDGRVTWSRGFGVANAERGTPVTERTAFEAASLSKPVVAYIALRLADEGRLDLDAPLTRYVPEPVVPGDPRLARITARRVLTHTSGFANWRGGEPLRIHFDPGERFSYSGEAFNYLQAALERLTGEPLEPLARRLVFEPLGMTSSSFVWQDRYDTFKAYAHDETGAVSGRRRTAEASAASSLLTTADDYARFVAAVLAGTGLRAETHREMLRAQVQADSACAVCVGRPAGARSSVVAWGLGWGLSPDGGDTLLWHWGDNGDARAYVAAARGSRRGVVILANGANGLSIAPEIAALALGTEAPGLAWLSYDRYDSPARTLLRRIAAGDASALHELEARQRGGTSDAPLAEAEVNGLGYRLLRRKKTPEAVRVLRLNVERFPESANTHDSLGEALLAAGDTAAAIASYRRAAELGLESSAAVVRQLTRPAVRVAPAILDAYTGTYDTPMGPLVVTRDGDSLAGTLGEEGAARLIPETESRFAVGGGGNTVEFFRDADGRVTHAIIRAGGQEIRATRPR